MNEPKIVLHLQEDFICHYLAACSSIGTLFHLFFLPLLCKGGNEKKLTVELPLLISFRARNAAIVLFMYKLSMYSISSSSGTVRASDELGFDCLCSPFSLSQSSVDVSGSFLGKRWSSKVSHSFTSLFSRSVVKKGCCSTFWMNGCRISAPVLLSYFFSIFTSPVHPPQSTISLCESWKNSWHEKFSLKHKSVRLFINKSLTL